jgi:hypothetical protein
MNRKWCWIGVLLVTAVLLLSRAAGAGGRDEYDGLAAQYD